MTSRYYSKIRLVVFSLVALLPLLYWWHVNPLPSDEEMISHFKAHRGEIEELVQKFREWKPSAELPNWHALPEIVALQKKAGVIRVKSLIPTWFPDPYSAEGAKQFRMKKIGLDHRYHSIGVELVNEKRRNRPFASVLLTTGPKLIFKELIYFPEVAKIEDGKLWWPVDEDGQLKRWGRIFPTLNEYPPNWKKAECVYRQIDAHWFIYMCIAAT